MKFCILGGGGYMGQVLARDLQAQGHQVVVLDLALSMFPNIDVQWNKISIIKGSILDRTKLTEALIGCDACFHLAAYGMSGGASLDRDMTHHVNVNGTNLVIAVCVELKVPRLIYASSVGVVFGEEPVFNLDESAPYLDKFLTPYAESKCIAEKNVLAVGRSGALQTCALRLRGFYGPGEIRATHKTADMCKKGYLKATFSKMEPCLSQYSGAQNVSQAMIKAEVSLRDGRHSPANAKPYFIVDGGHPVDNMGFWYPLVRSLGAPVPSFKVPYHLVYFLAFLAELLYHVCGIEPLLTRFEVNLVALYNTYSIERAQKDFGYAPTGNHCLNATIDYYRKYGVHSFKNDKNNDKTPLPSDQFWSKLLTFVAIAVGSSVLWPIIAEAMAQHHGGNETVF